MNRHRSGVLVAAVLAFDYWVVRLVWGVVRFAPGFDWLVVFRNGPSARRPEGKDAPNSFCSHMMGHVVLGLSRLGKSGNVVATQTWRGTRSTQPAAGRIPGLPAGSQDARLYRTRRCRGQDRGPVLVDALTLRDRRCRGARAVPASVHRAAIDPGFRRKCPSSFNQAKLVAAGLS